LPISIVLVAFLAWSRPPPGFANTEQNIYPQPLASPQGLKKFP